MNYVYYSDHLEHHGILGMKWGVRKYQNSDGTWTEEGLQRRRSNKHVNSDGSLTELGMKKYSNARTMHDLIHYKHQQAVNDYNKGKLSKKALDQLDINEAEINYLNARQKVLNKEMTGARIGSTVGGLALGTAYVASTLSTYGAVPVGSTGIMTGYGSVIGGSIGTIIGSSMASKDIDRMRDLETAFIKSMPEKKRDTYLDETDPSGELQRNYALQQQMQTAVRLQNGTYV